MKSKAPRNEKNSISKEEHFHDVSRQISDVLSELRTLLGVVGIIFGFLLSASVFQAELVPVKQQLLMLSIISSILSIGIFSIPVLYHHIQFPYPNREKFIMRSHQFIVLGFLPTVLMFFLSTTFALFDFFGYLSFLVSFLIFALFVVVYMSRKTLFHF